MVGQQTNWKKLRHGPEVINPGFTSRMAKEVRNERQSESLQKFPNGQEKYIHTGTIPNVRLKGRVKPIVSARSPHTTPLMPLSGSSFSSGFLASSSNRMHELSSVVSDIESSSSITDSIKDPTSVEAVVAALQQTQSAKTGIKRFRYLEPDEANKKQKVSNQLTPNDKSLPKCSENTTSGNIGEKRPLDLSVSSNESLDGLHISPENKRRCIPDPRQASLSSANNVQSRRTKTTGRDTPFSLYDSLAGSDDSESMYSHQSEQSLRDQRLESSFKLTIDHLVSVTPTSTRDSAPSGMDTQCSSRATTPTKASQALNLDNYRADKAKNQQRLSKMLGMLFNTSDDEGTAAISDSALKNINKKNNELLHNNENISLTAGLQDKKIPSKDRSDNHTFKINPSQDSVGNNISSSEKTSKNGKLLTSSASPATAKSILIKSPQNLEISVMDRIDTSTSISHSSIVPSSSISPSGLDKTDKDQCSEFGPQITSIISNLPVKDFTTVTPISSGITSVSASPTISVNNPLPPSFISPSTHIPSINVSKSTFSSNLENSTVCAPEESPLVSACKPVLSQTVSNYFTTKTTLSKQNESLVSDQFKLSGNENERESKISTEYISKSPNVDKENSSFAFAAPARTTQPFKTLNTDHATTAPPFKTITEQAAFNFTSTTASLFKTLTTEPDLTTPLFKTVATVSTTTATPFNMLTTDPTTTAPSFKTLTSTHASLNLNATSVEPTFGSISNIKFLDNPSKSSNLFSFSPKSSNSSLLAETNNRSAKAIATATGSNLFDSVKTPYNSSTEIKPSIFSFPLKSAIEHEDNIVTKPSSLFTFKPQEKSKVSKNNKVESSPFAVSKPSLGFLPPATPFLTSCSDKINSSNLTMSATPFASSNSTLFKGSSLTMSGTPFPISSSTTFKASSLTNAFTPAQVVTEKSKLNIENSTTNAVSSIFSFGSAPSSGPTFNAVSCVPQIGSDVSSSPFQFGGTSSVSPFGSTTASFVSTIAKPEFGMATTTSTIPQFGANDRISQFGSGKSDLQFGSKNVSNQLFGGTAGAPFTSEASTFGQNTIAVERSNPFSFGTATATPAASSVARRPRSRSTRRK